MQQKLIRNIWAVGRNYADHAAEMKAEVPKAPMIFLKAGTSAEAGSKITLPKWSKDVHYELELAYRVDENLSFSHITLALDLTARDAQAEAKKSGAPWTLAKSFTGSCPMGSWVSLDEIANSEEIHFNLKINKQLKQSGHSKSMIFSPEILLQYVKNHFPVVASDVLLSGTPSGVGSLTSGDNLEATLQSEGRTLLTCIWDVE